MTKSKIPNPRWVGFRMPAEWEPHEATWIGWPHNRSDWPGKFALVPWVYGEIVRKLAEGEIVRILVNSGEHEARARNILRRLGVDAGRVEFFPFPTNRGWTRDFGPLFVHRGRHKAAGPALAREASRPRPNRLGRPARALRRQQSFPPPLWGEGPGVRRSEIAIVRFRFNAWAKYPDWEMDDNLPERVAQVLRCPLLPARADGRDFVLEGGSIDVNGRGSLLTTEECLLDPKVQVRNPGLGRVEIERALKTYLGVSNVLWLKRGIAGDDTHGHVDDICRFVAPRTVVLCQEEDPSDANYLPLAENRERLEGMRLEDGSKIEVAALPMPLPLYLDGQRLPASYANFYIANGAVLVPTFNDPNDRVALGVLGELFGDRVVVGIHAVDLVWGLGTLHCATQQQPADGSGKAMSAATLTGVTHMPRQN
jgi:agmatine deiminase